MKLISSMGALTLLAAFSSAQTLYSNNFDVDTSANWSYFSNVTGDTALQSDFGNAANFFFDYSTVGISSAPGSLGGTTRGLRLQANMRTTPNATGAIYGLSVSPIGLTLSGDYKLSFQAWQNYHGPLGPATPGPVGGNGSTHVTIAGIGVSGTTIQVPGSNITGTAFGATADGGSTVDYRVYNGTPSSAAPSTGFYAAGNTTGVNNSTNSFWTSKFTGVAAPAAQLALFPGQTGTTDPGAIGFAWRRWEIEKIGTTVTWKVDGFLFATVTNAVTPGGNLFFAQSDINAGASTDANSDALQFGLIDNVQVEAVPEPATMTVLGLAALAALKRRKK